MTLAGKTALITGASKGLGKTIAQSLAAAGAQIILVSRDARLLDEVNRAIQSCNGKCEHHPADVTDEAEVQQLAERVRRTHAHLDILVNNAGINVRKPMVDFSLDEWERVLRTNLTGAFLVCRAFVPMMKGRGYGRVINMTSMMSHVALPGRTAYCASKAGLLGFTRALALELAPDGITVNGVSPGPIATEMNRPIYENPELNQQFISRIPLGRWGQLDEIGKLVLYLCSPESGFLTGTDIVIDGGWSTQ